METSADDAPSRKPYFFVLQTGLITTALALAGVYWLNAASDEFQIMGLYANYVIPVGAVIVGAIAGSGYGLASWFTGVRISRGLLWLVLLLQTGAYIAAEYVEYRDAVRQLEAQGLVMGDSGELPGFLEYYNFKAQTFAWKSRDGKSDGEPLGKWGYVFVLLGAAGFILSGLIAPAVLFAVPYCDACQRYMTTKELGVIPASVPARKIRKSDQVAQEAHAKEQNEAADLANAAVDRIKSAVAAEQVDTFNQELAAAGNAKANNKLPARIEIKLVCCKACNGGRIEPALVAGHGNNIQRTRLESIAASAQFVQSIRGGKPA